MEEINLFDDLIQQPTEVRYCLGFNPTKGRITGLYPTTSTLKPKNTVDIPTEIADKLLEGLLRPEELLVDTKTKNLIFAENFDQTDSTVIYRVPDAKFTNVEDPDLILSYNGTVFSVELSARLGGIYGKFNDDVAVLQYPDGMIIHLLITKYNNPNIIMEVVKIPIEKLYGMPYNITVALPKKFSVFTRKIFQEYTLFHEDC